MKIKDSVKETAWDVLYHYYGETLDKDGIRLMDTVLKTVKEERKEYAEEFANASNKRDSKSS